MEISFCKLKNKDVVNVCDGKNYGNITDIIFDTCCGRILGIIVPCNKSFFQLFKSSNDIFIPYNRICKIGKDIILVDIIMQTNCEVCNSVVACNTPQNEQLQNKTQQKFNIQSVLEDIKLNKWFCQQIRSYCQYDIHILIYNAS